jgi:hypothetical protein
MEFVLLSVMLAQLGELMEHAQPAIKDITSSMEPALSLISTAQLTSDVKDGTGIIKSALNALPDGLKELMEFAYQ